MFIFSWRKLYFNSKSICFVVFVFTFYLYFCISIYECVHQPYCLILGPCVWEICSSEKYWSIHNVSFKDVNGKNSSVHIFTRFITPPPPPTVICSQTLQLHLILPLWVFRDSGFQQRDVTFLSDRKYNLIMTHTFSSSDFPPAFHDLCRRTFCADHISVSQSVCLSNPPTKRALSW